MSQTTIPSPREAPELKLRRQNTLNLKQLWPQVNSNAFTSKQLRMLVVLRWTKVKEKMGHDDMDCNEKQQSQ